MNIVSVRSDLLENFREREYREAFVEESVYTLLSFQIRTLREQREWSQKQLGILSRMAQERISILEDPNADTKPTLSTLLRLAAAFDVGLDVRFVPFSKVIDGAFDNTPDALRIPSFEDELFHGGSRSPNDTQSAGKVLPQRLSTATVNLAATLHGAKATGDAVLHKKQRSFIQRQYRTNVTRKPVARSYSKDAA